MKQIPLLHEGCFAVIIREGNYFTSILYRGKAMTGVFGWLSHCCVRQFIRMYDRGM